MLVAQRNKERTDGVELERVERERMIEQIERERVTQLKQIESEKAVEQQRKEIQDVIRERVMVENLVVEEQQTDQGHRGLRHRRARKEGHRHQCRGRRPGKPHPTDQGGRGAQAGRPVQGGRGRLPVTTAAEASRQAAKLGAEEKLIMAEAYQAASEKEAAGKNAARRSPHQGIRRHRHGRGRGDPRQGEPPTPEAIREKADAMKLFEEAGQDHEEFKLELDKDKTIELAQIDVQRQIAEQQAIVIGEALKHSKIDIVGGETEFFDRITRAITTGKVVDRTIGEQPGARRREGHLLQRRSRSISRPRSAPGSRTSASTPRI